MVLVPTQASRIDSLEDNLLTLQTSIPKHKSSLDRFADIIKYFEESQSKIRAESTKKLEKYSRSQGDIKTTVTLLMTEVKSLSDKVSRLALIEVRQTNNFLGYKERLTSEKSRNDPMEYEFEDQEY